MSSAGINSIMNKVEMATTETSKKSWAKPVYDIISKDIVKGGTVAAGKESTGATKYS